MVGRGGRSAIEPRKRRHADGWTVTTAYINRVATAVPDHEVHGTFVDFAGRMLRDRRSRLLFERMVARAQIERRWSQLAPAGAGSNESLDADGFYTLRVSLDRGADEPLRA